MILHVTARQTTGKQIILIAWTSATYHHSLKLFEESAINFLTIGAMMCVFMSTLE